MFLHSYHPKSILLEFGPVRIYWYGFFIVLGIFVAFAVTRWLLEKYGRIKNHPLPLLIKDGNQIVDLSVYLIIGGLVGARLAHVIAEWQYYISRPLEIFKIWNGGLWIYGAIAGGFAWLLVYVCCNKGGSFRQDGGQASCRLQFGKRKRELWDVFKLLLDILAPGLVFAQAIGRWGNYFNQELYGLPTRLPWGIPIDAIHRISGFTGSEFFHPVFLYESLWCVIVGVVLLRMHNRRFTSPNPSFVRRGMIFLRYLFLYSFGRFIFEFLRIDPVPMVFGVRITQIAAGGVMLAAAGMLIAEIWFKQMANRVN